MPLSKIRSNRDVKSYYRQTQHLFNHVTRDCMIQVDLSHYLTLDKFDTRLIDSLNNGEGKIHEETIIAIINLAEAILQRKNVRLLGLIQSAKTATQAIGAIVSCIALYLRDGKITIPLFGTPVGESFEGQFKSKLKKILICFKEAKVTYRGKGSIKISDYLSLSQERNYTSLEEKLEGEKGQSLSLTKINKLGKEMHDIFSIDDPNCPVMQLSKKYIGLLNLFFSSILDNDFNLLFMRDECHAASSKDSINDKIFKEEIIGHGRSFYDMLQSRDHLQCVLTSATNWQGYHLTPVVIPINGNYVGLDHRYDFEGQSYKIADGLNKLPVIRDLSEMATLIGNRDLADVMPACYSSRESFRKKSKLVKRYKSFENYQESCVLALADLFMWIKENKPKPCNFSDKEAGNAIVFRFMNDNEMMDDFLDKLMEQLSPDSMRIVKGYGEFGKYNRVEDLLKSNRVQEDEFCIFCATAKARMSDTFPQRFSYGVDLTKDSGTLTSLGQGVFGRLCGYFKDPYIILSVDNAKTIRSYITADYDITKIKKKVHQDVIRMKERTGLQIRLEDFKNHPLIVEMFQELNKVRMTKVLCKTRLAKRSKDSSIFTYECGRDPEIANQFWKVIKKYFSYIKGHMDVFGFGDSDVELMKPGVAYGSRMIVWKDEKKKIPAFVTRTDGDDSNNGGTTDDKFVIRVKSAKGNRSPKIVGIVFPLVNKEQIIWKKNVISNTELASKMKEGYELQ